MSSVSPSALPQTAIALDRVSQVFGAFPALRQIFLHLPAGSSAVLLGENGAGKSTLLRLLAGLSAPTHGEVRIWGRRPQEQRGRIAYAAHSNMLYDELTGPENLLYFARLHDARSTKGELADRAAEALGAVGLDPRNPRRVGEYSQGMRQRASLARVLQSQPDLLLLDEPFSNLDAASAKAMVACLQQYLQKGGREGLPRTLLLTTHQAELARPLARTTLVLNAGRLVTVDSEAGIAMSQPHPAYPASFEVRPT